MGAAVSNDTMKSGLDLAATDMDEIFIKFSPCLVKAVFREGMLECGFEQALASSMDHTEKSTGLRSGLLGDHISFNRNEGKTSEQNS